MKIVTLSHFLNFASFCNTAFGFSFNKKDFFSFEMFHEFKNLPQNYRFVTSSLSFLFIIQHVPAKCQKSCLKNLFSRPIIITNLWADTAAGASLGWVNGCYCTNSFLWSTLHKTSGFQHPVIAIYHIFC